MITYKNISSSAKTFYGVKFEPGDVKSVPGYINNQGMVRIFGVAPDLNKKPIYEVPSAEHTRGRKKKSTEPEKDSLAETETIIDTIEEETSNGNPS